MLYYRRASSPNRPRSAAGPCEQSGRDYFRLEVDVFQFQGQWLHSKPPRAWTRIGWKTANNRLGFNALAGEACLWGTFKAVSASGVGH